MGSMVALSLMTVLSVIIGRIFHSVPAQFQTSKFLVLLPCPMLLYLEQLLYEHVSDQAVSTLFYWLRCYIIRCLEIFMKSCKVIYPCIYVDVYIYMYFGYSLGEMWTLFILTWHLDIGICLFGMSK